MRGGATQACSFKTHPELLWEVLLGVAAAICLQPAPTHCPLHGMCGFQGSDPLDLSSAERCRCIPGNGDCGALKALLSHFKPHNLDKFLTFLDSFLSSTKWKEQNVPDLKCMGSGKYLESRKCFIEPPPPPAHGFPLRPVCDTPVFQVCRDWIRKQS